MLHIRLASRITIPPKIVLRSSRSPSFWNHSVVPSYVKAVEKRGVSIRSIATAGSTLSRSVIRTQMLTMSTESKVNPAESQLEVLHRKHLGGRIFILNRPKVLNALNLNMIRNMTPQLEAWDQSDLVNVIILKSNHPKAFCSGGDVKQLVVDFRTGVKNVEHFFYEEYKLNHLIATSTKPIVAFWNGITMGGGVGISLHAPFRIVTENSLFAMPETAIGLYPDVGGSFFLPRMDGQLGIYLGLTGQILAGSDVFFAGIGTHFVPSQRLSALEERLCELETGDWDVVNAAIEEFSEVPDQNFALSQHREIIDRCFAFDTVEQIIAALEKEGGEFAKKTLDQLTKMSPTSLKLTLSQLRRGKKLDIAATFQQEWTLSSQVSKLHDFSEGVYHKLIMKKQTVPNWKPTSLSEVTPQFIDEIFNYKPKVHLKFIRPVTYSEYPHRYLALPKEEDIRRVVTGEDSSVGHYAFENFDSVANWFVEHWPTAAMKEECKSGIVEEGKVKKGTEENCKFSVKVPKVGIKERVMDVVERCCIVGENGVRWKYPYPV